MRYALVVIVAMVSVSCQANHPKSPSSASMSAPAQSKQAMLTPAEIKWQDALPSLPPGAKIAILEGDPAKEGYFAMRLRLPDGYRVQAHWHPNTERVTVISGTLNLAMGDKFGEGPVRALPAGSYSFMPPGMHHWAWATGPTELQLATIGPWRIIYINPADDPRNASGAKSK